MTIRRPAVLGALCALVVLVAGATPAGAISTGLVISQVYGGGGNTGAQYTNDFVEIFNRGSSPVSLSGWSLQYASATGTGALGANATQLTELPDVTVAPGQYFLVQEGAGAGNGSPLPAADLVDPTPIAMAAGAGKVALVTGTASLGCNGGSTPCGSAELARIVDLVGYGNANFFEGAAAAPTLTNTTAAIRNAEGCAETDENGADFAAAAPTPRTTASAVRFCDAENAPSVASTTPSSGATGVAQNANVTITFSEDVTVSGGWYAIACATSGPHEATASGGPQTFTLDSTTDFTPGESCTVTVEADLVSDVDLLDPPDTMANDFAFDFTVFAPPPILPIGVVQGPVSDTVDGATHASPRNGQTVRIQGVIFEKTITRTSAGAQNFGFFVQNTPATDDDDPTSSDGIFVFMSTFTSLIGGYIPQVGDEVVLSGRVSEFFGFTELVSASAETVLRSGVPLDLELPASDVNPPDSLADANRYWERLEGMRLRVPAGALVLDGRDVFPSTADGEAWVMRGDHPLAARVKAYERRSFRDPHPLDNHPEALFDDGNGYRILLASHGLKGASGDSFALISPTRTFDTVTNSLVGGLNFAFSKYQIEVGEQPTLMHGVEPAKNAPPTAPKRLVEYSMSDYNVENLYDYRDDPNDGCDFTGNTGCPGVSPPFDYVPASDAEYQTRLGLIAEQIVKSLHSPDLLMTQEAEDQDICVVQADALSCGIADNADGKPDTLQELALAIRRAGGPAYEAAYDRNGADARGIVAAFMYRTDRVQLLPVAAGDPVFGSSPQVVYRGTPLSYNTDVQNPKVLNAVLPADVDRSTGVDGSNVYTRAPQVGSFRIWRNGIGRGGWVDLYAISNHFSSTPDARVGQRREQAAYNAAIVDVLEGSRSRVITAGDFNVFPRPDDPFAPGHPQYPSDQLGPLYSQGLNNLWDVEADEAPQAAYSYVFVGMAQTLDHQFVTDTLLDELVQARTAHVNADYPADFAGDGAFGLSDHDPMVSRYELAATLERLRALLDYYRDVIKPKTYDDLVDRLDRAQSLRDAGKRASYLAQLAVFGVQVAVAAPRNMPQAVANTLVSEATLVGVQALTQ